MNAFVVGIRYVMAAAVVLLAVGTALSMYESYWDLFVSYPVYVGLYALLVLVAFGWFGRIFGLSNLLWHEKGRTQLIGGASVTLLMVLIAVISYEAMQDHDGDRFMEDMRKFRDAAPVARLSGVERWPVDHWEVIDDLDIAYELALKRWGTGTDRWVDRGSSTSDALGNLMKAMDTNRKAAIRTWEENSAGDFADEPGKAGEVDAPGGRKIVFETFKEYATERDVLHELDESRLLTMRNRWALFFLSATAPWIGLLWVPALLNGTPAWRWLSQMIRPSETPMTLGAARGWCFVAGSVLVMAIALASAWGMPGPVLRLGALTGFDLIPDTKDGQGIWSMMQTTPNLFLQTIISQIVFLAVLICTLMLLRRPSLYRRVMTPVSLCLILAIFSLVYGVFVHLSHLHLLFQLGAAVAIGVIVLSQNRSAFKLRFPFMTLDARGSTYYESAHRVDIPQFYSDTPSGSEEAHLYHVSEHESRPTSRPSPGPEPAVLLDSEAVLDRWKDAVPRSEGECKPVLAVVTTSGGSIRAAVWTAKVLTKLEGVIPGFPHHVRLVTGASGGMLGAALYVADLDEPDPASPSWPERPESRRIAAIDGLPGDNLSAVARCLALHDLPGLIQWGPQATDRGRALEEVWEESHPAMATPFRDLAAGEAAGWRPSLVFSPMLVEDGRRLLISNLDLEHLTTNVGSFLLDEPSRRLSRKARKHDSEDVYSLSAYQFYRLFPRASAFRLSTAVRMSATFPFASPAVSLPTHPPRRVVDAGYYDNFGINAAAMWILHHRAWLLEHTAGVVLIQIRAFDSPRDIHPPDCPADRDGHNDRSWLNGLRFITSPLKGVAQARRAVMSFRNDEQLEILSDWFGDHADRPDFFQSVSFECPASASLSWHITNEERQGILDSFEPNGGGDDDPARINHERLKALKCWWMSTCAVPS